MYPLSLHRNLVPVARLVVATATTVAQRSGPAVSRRGSVILGLVLLAAAAGTARSQAIPPLGPLTVSSATAGLQPNQATGSTPYSATLVFAGQMKVVGNLNTNMPANTTLSVRLTAPSGGTSLGNVNLDTSPRDLVIAATPVFFTNVTILYTFRPTVLAGVIPVTSRTVTFTLATYP